MRKLTYILFGLMIFAGAAGLFYNRQMQPADDGPAAFAPSNEKTRGMRPYSADRQAMQQRRFERGIRQYRQPDGSLNTFRAVIDVLNVVVGIIGIGLALNGMRMRRGSSSHGA
jgi:hypothetical protein